MEVIKLPLGLIQTNCYIIKTSEENAVVIDPGDEPERLLRWFEKDGSHPSKILLTHGHFDHTGAVSALRAKYGCEVWISKEDEPMLTDGEKAMAYLIPGRPYVNRTADRNFSDGDTVAQDGIIFTVISTPGHTAGSVCFLTDGAIFTGDTLFSGSVGRTDCWSGSYSELMKSVERLKELDDNLTVYCGHGEDTTLGTEKAVNPFML